MLTAGLTVLWQSEGVPSPKVACRSSRGTWVRTRRPSTNWSRRDLAATPVTAINGEAVVGINCPRLEQLLGSQRSATRSVPEEE